MSKSLSFTNLNDEADKEEEELEGQVKPPLPQTRPVSRNDRNNNNRYSDDPPPIPPRASQQMKQQTAGKSSVVVKKKEESSSSSSSSRQVETPAKAQSQVASKIQYLTGSLADDCYILEETVDDCVYQITYKKVYNKNINTDSNTYNNNTLSSNASLTKNYSDYRLSSQATANAFKMLLSVSNSSNNLLGSSPGAATTTTSNDEHNSAASTGLVYTRVKTKQLKYASLKKFVEHLTSEETGELDSSLVQTFLATYRTFSDTRTVLEAIRARYEQILPASLDMTEDVRVENLRSFRSLMKMWLDGYAEDFNEPPEFKNLGELDAFVHKHMPETELGQVIESKLEQFREDNAALSDPNNNLTKSSVYAVGTGHFLKNNKSFSHQRQHSHHHLQHRAAPGNTSSLANATTQSSAGGTSMNAAKASGQHHRRSYSNFTELANTNSSSMNGAESSRLPATTPPNKIKGKMKILIE
jgi:hypothetical protein